MKKILAWLKNDYAGVSESLRDWTNNRIPKIGVTIWYIMLFPIGILLWGALQIWKQIYIWKLYRDIRKSVQSLEGLYE